MKYLFIIGKTSLEYIKMVHIIFCILLINKQLLYLKAHRNYIPNYNHTLKFSPHRSIKKGYFSKIRIILLILYLLLFISSRYENWTDPLNPIQKETEELFIDFNDASSNLQIKQSVTQEKIDRLYDRLKSVPETKENLYQKLKISSWIQEAEKQLYKELPPEQTEFLVVKVNTGK